MVEKNVTYIKQKVAFATFCFIYNLRVHFCNIVDKSFGFCPAEAGVSDGLTVYAFSDLLCAVFDVAFDHEALDKLLDIRVVATAMENFLGNTNLFKRLFAGVCVVGIHDNGFICEILCRIYFAEREKVFVVVVREGVTLIVNVTAKDGVCEGVTVALNFPTAVNECVGVLCGSDCVHHDGKVAGGGVLHTDGDIKTAGGQTVFLVFNGTRTDGNVCEQVVEVTVVIGVKHFIRTAEAGFTECAHMEFTDCDNTLDQVGLAVGIGLMEHTLVAVARGTGLTGINTG